MYFILFLNIALLDIEPLSNVFFFKHIMLALCFLTFVVSTEKSMQI